MKNYYKLRAYLLLSLLCVTFAFGTRAQVNGYGFSTGTGTFTPLVGGTATSLVATADDAISTAFPIGFNFVYGGTTYTTVQACSNGPLLFGTGRTQAAANNLATGTLTQRPGVVPLWDDLQCMSGVTYQLSGSAPNQVLTVEWLNMEWNYLSNTSVISFQVKLYETSNIIEFNYRQEATAVNTGSGGASIGIMGTAATDYISLQNSSASPTLSTTTAMNTITAKPATDQIYRFVPPPAAPPTPTQDPAAPTCVAGTQINLAGPPPAGITWYWQTSATGTSTANPYSGPYTVFANGTYYARAYDATNNVWSTTSSSITISNYPVATAPPTPTADINPSCVTTGTILTEAAAPAGYVYYWQGTTMNGQSTTLNASSPYTVSTSGTYYVAAYETASQCWSNTVGLAVAVNSYIPAAPTDPITNYNICTGTVSQPITASAAGGVDTVSAASGSINIPIPDSNPTGISHTQTISGIPAGATVTGIMVNLTIPHTFDADLDIYLVGANGTQIELSTDNGGGGDNYTNTTFSSTAATNITAGTAPFTGTFLPEGSFPSLYSVGNGNWTIKVIDDLGGDVGTLNYWNLSIIYSLPPATVAWYDAASAGNSLGTGSPLETVGTSVLPNTSTPGAYHFFAESNSGGCVSTTRLDVTVNVTSVLAQLNPIHVTCSGGSNGSFTLGTVQCGTGPFLYSLDGGMTFGAIPTNLTAGTYSIIMQDQGAGNATSAPISVTINEPGIPTGLALVDANYFTADVTWTPQGDETQWLIEYGPAGFTPGTGMTTTATATTWTLTGLSANTSYDFYVAADCGGTDNWAGPFTFNTNSGFYTYDNNCAGGYTDISTTGTNNVLADDAEVGVTLPFAFNFQGTSYTDITIGNNGGIIFGTLTGQVGFGNGAIGGAPTGLYPFWDDLGGNGTGVFYQTIGTAPNQQFIIQWNKEHLSGPGEYAFQIVLDEATQEAYFYYDEVAPGNAAIDYGASATIGASGPVDVQVSLNNTTFLQNNSCVHFYNALCPNPINITVQEFAEEAFLNWGAGLYGETEWTVIYGPAGFDPAAVPSQAIGTDMVSSPDDILSNLTQMTTYDVYIYSECTADNLTSGGVLVTFTTLPLCADPTNVIPATAEDTLMATWNWISPDPGTYPATSFVFDYGYPGFTPGTGFMAGVDADDFADTVVNASFFMGGGVYEMYLQAVCGGTDDSSNFVGPYTFVMPLSNDTVCGAENLMADGTVYTFNNTGATVSSGEASIAPPANGAQVTNGWINSTLNNTTWFTFQAPASGNIRINNTAIGYNGQAAVYSATDCADYVTFLLHAANDNEIGGASLAPNFTVCGLTPGATYYLLHDGFNGTTGNYSISISPITLEAGTANPVTDICTGSDIDLFTTIAGNNGTNGVWSSSIPTVNAGISGSMFGSAGLSYNVFNFQYRMTDGCAYDSIVSQVHIFPPSTAGTDGALSVCRNQPVDLLAGLGGIVDVGGTWYDPANNPMVNSMMDASNIPGQYNFDYIVGNGVCPDDTANVVLTVLASCDYLDVQEAVFSGVSLYPNPSEGMVFIASDAAGTFDYVVTDAKGRMVMEMKGGVKAAQTSEINLSAVETGVYFIRLSNSEAEKVFRVVIQ